MNFAETSQNLSNDFASEREPVVTVRSLEEDQATHLSHLCRGPKSVPCWLPHCWFNLSEPL